MRCLAIAFALGVLALAPAAQADPAEYGILSAGASESSHQAGDHPDFTVDFELNKTPSGELPASARSTVFELPPGFLTNPTAVPACSAAQLDTFANALEGLSGGGCPQDSQVGVTEIQVLGNGGLLNFLEPVYNMVPRPREPARLGFIGQLFPVFIDTELRSATDYGATAYVEGVTSLVPLLGAKTTIWGVPADPAHDAERLTPLEATAKGAPETPSGKRASGLFPVPYTANETSCGGSREVTLKTDSYALPGQFSLAHAPLPPLSGCPLLDFSPRLSIKPTSFQTTTGSGLDVSLAFPTAGFEHPNLLAEAQQRRVEVALPEGLTVNPSQAAGLGACSEAAFARESASSLAGEGCPGSSKIGTLAASSPLIEEPATGSLYLAAPDANPFNSLIAVYLVLRIPDRGVLVKLAGEVKADPSTGRLTASFGKAPYEIPRLPVSSFDLHFREGARAPLITPSGCGSYQSDATFTSWAGQIATTHPRFEITTGPGGGPCPPSSPPFHPRFEAGANDINAGSFSPYYLRLNRSDDEQELTRFSTTLPRGSLAKLAGVAECPDTDIAAAVAKSGSEELASPSCPEGSNVANLLAGAGVGSVLSYVPGEIYLAGPYDGAPLSLVAIVPAVAGPFDLGTVVRRVALRIDPDSGVAEIDGSESQPFPHIIDGIPLRLRDLRVYVNRPDFTTNPTSCDLEAFSAELWGGGENPFSSADDSPAELSERFQVANCSLLPFKPRLSLTLKGFTKRTSHPKLIANLTAKPGEANIARAQVRLPKAAFLDNAHIQSVCTRVQFAADACPPTSVYGRASAVTPLLDQPLSGPVYLRSSSHLLPDLVVKLRGPDSQPIEIDLAARTDSVKDALRNTFEAVPDAPVTKFHLELFGGKRGLIELSSGLCAHPRAAVKLDGQNGKVHDTNPVVRTSCKEAPRRSPR